VVDAVAGPLQGGIGSVQFFDFGAAAVGLPAVGLLVAELIGVLIRGGGDLLDECEGGVVPQFFAGLEGEVVGVGPVREESAAGSVEPLDGGAFAFLRIGLVLDELIPFHLTDPLKILIQLFPLHLPSVECRYCLYWGKETAWALNEFK
jgi:hypothetical protein